MLTQAEADSLIGLLKRIKDTEPFGFPCAGEHKSIELAAVDASEDFIVDINRSRIKVTKCTYQNRYRKDIILLRLDIDGGSHTNPDGTQIGCPHLHVYKEGYDDRWAYEMPKCFSRSEDLIDKLIEFLKYCNVDNADELAIQEAI
jgi:hypothetical protein